jgi:hypothetical protein
MTIPVRFPRPPRPPSAVLPIYNYTEKFSLLYTQMLDGVPCLIHKRPRSAEPARQGYRSNLPIAERQSLSFDMLGANAVFRSRGPTGSAYHDGDPGVASRRCVGTVVQMQDTAHPPGRRHARDPGCCLVVVVPERSIVPDGFTKEALIRAMEEPSGP